MSNLGFSDNQGQIAFRIRVLMIAIACCILFFLVRLFFMQVFQGAVYGSRAEELARQTQVIPAKRGMIFDRSYDQAIVSNYDVYTLVLNPTDNSKEATSLMLQKLADYLHLPLESFTKRLPANLKLYHPVELRSGIRYQDIVYVAEHMDEFPGISWQNKPIRYYDEGNAMAQVLGYVGEITPEELQVLYNRGYTENSLIGKAGIEKTYDAKLRGKDGKRLKRVDAKGQGIATDTIDIPPELGHNLVLTLDRNIQRLAQRVLGKRIGSIMVLKPASGEVLAMVSYPSYDPNLFYSEQSSAVFSKLSSDPRSPFLNRNIQSGAPPASTFKILMASAVIEEEAFPSSSTVLCTGSIQIGNRSFHCHLRTGHGRVDLATALAESCNIYFYTMGNEYLRVSKIVDYSYRFGFGEITGIDLPGEASGNVPTPEWKQLKRGTPWVGGDTVNFSIGQGDVLTTPIQLADMVAAIVNDGMIQQPHILKEIRSPETFQIVETVQTKPLRNVNLSKETLDEVRRAMRLVVTDGTPAEVMTTKAVKIAGKTGTSETGNIEGKHSWFVAYGPYDYTDINDVVAAVIWIDSVNEWDWWAPKAANLLFHGIFTQKDYEQTVADLQPLWYLPSPEPLEETVANAPKQ